MMSGHGPNPIFFNKKKKDWMSRTHSLSPSTLRPLTSHFYLTPPRTPLKVDDIYLERDRESKRKNILKIFRPDAFFSYPFFS